MFRTFVVLDVSGKSDIRLNYQSIHAPSLELEDTYTTSPPWWLVIGFWLSYWVLESTRLQRNFLWGKVRPALRADNSAVLVLPIVKVRTEDQRSIPFSESS